jgi:desulfoferrodoxin (superoxide reductase-like protein)
LSQNIRRRDVIRAVPLVVFGSAVAGFGRFLLGCSAEAPDMRTSGPTKGAPDVVAPNDDDEYIKGTGEPPVVANETPPTVPNAQWEARARQLEDDQLRLYGAVFTQEAPGIMAGKQRSHVPQATVTVEKGLARVTVLVEHSMGKNLLEGGAPPPDAAADVLEAGDAADAARDAAREAEAGPAVDAGKAPVHYITTIFLRGLVAGKETIVGIWELASDDAAPPTVKFTLPVGVTSVVAYEWCTLHGLWKSAAVPV